MGHLEGKKERERERDENTLLSLPSLIIWQSLPQDIFKKLLSSSQCAPCLGPQHLIPAKGARELVPGEVLGMDERKHDKEWCSYISAP